MASSHPISRQYVGQKRARVIKTWIEARDDVPRGSMSRARRLSAGCQGMTTRAAVELALDDKARSVGCIQGRDLGNTLASAVQMVEGILLLRVLHSFGPTPGRGGRDALDHADGGRDARGPAAQGCLSVDRLTSFDASQRSAPRQRRGHRG